MEELYQSLPSQQATSSPREGRDQDGQQGVSNLCNATVQRSISIGEYGYELLYTRYTHLPGLPLPLYLHLQTEKQAYQLLTMLGNLEKC